MTNPLMIVPMRPIHVRLPIPWVLLLKSRARKEKTNVSEVVRIALEEYAEKRGIQLEDAA